MAGWLEVVAWDCQGSIPTAVCECPVEVVYSWLRLATGVAIAGEKYATAFCQAACVLDVRWWKPGGCRCCVVGLAHPEGCADASRAVGW